MKHSTLCKLAYLVCTPVTKVNLWIKGVKTKGLVYSAGLLFVNRNSGGMIAIGNNCRFMSLQRGNNIGLNHVSMLSVEKKGSIAIGDNCSFSGVSIRCFNSIQIGNNVRVGANCLIIDGDAHQNDPRAGKNKPIVIEDNVWLGANVVVKKGVTIGRNSVIGMNSVVSKDIPANCVAIGNPCVVVKTFNEAKVDEIELFFK